MNDHESSSLPQVWPPGYPLEDIIDAHRYVDTGHKRGNVVVDVQAN